MKDNVSRTLNEGITRNWPSFYLPLVALLLATGAFPQSKLTLQGRIADRDGNPVHQATVAVMGATIGTYTDDYGHDTVTTSGIVAHREADDKQFYYYNKVSGTTSMNATNEEYSHVSTIDAETMEVETHEDQRLRRQRNDRKCLRRLLQSITSLDEDDNLYLACFNDTDDMEAGVLLRFNAGETNFDSSYNGFADADGKVYFGVNPPDFNPMVYINDIETVEEGAQIEGGYYFERIRLNEDYVQE